MTIFAAILFKIILKMKKLLIGLFCLANVNLFAQDLDIQWGEAFDSKTTVKKIIGMHDGVMYTYSGKGMKTFIEGFDDEKYAKQFSTQFQLPKYQDKKVKLLELVMTSDGPIAIGFQSQKAKKTFRILVIGFNSNGSIKGKYKEIIEEQSGERSKGVNFLVKTSEDKSKVLFALLREKAKTKKHVSDIVVMNKDLEVISENVIDVDLSEYAIEDSKGKIFYRADVHLDNDGSYVTLVETMARIRGSHPKNIFRIKDYTISGELSAEEEIDLDDKGISAPFVQFDDVNKTIKLFGFYNELDASSKKERGFVGVYAATISRGDLELIDKNATDFPDEFLKNILKAKKVEKASDKGQDLGIAPFFRVNHVYQDAENNTVVAAEYYTYTVREDNNGNRVETWTFGDIITMSIDENGKLNWIEHLEKRQVATRTTPKMMVSFGGISVNVLLATNAPQELYNWSYLSGLTENFAYVIYNDHFKNTTKEKTIGSAKKAIPYLVTYRLEDGANKKTTVTKEADKTGTKMAPRVYFKISDSQFIVWAVRKKENKFGVVTFVEDGI
jgi:hypothetical protein